MKIPETKKPGPRPINTDAFNKIKTLGIGKMMVMQKKQWKLIAPPGAIILRRRLGREYEVKSLVDDSGWLISRKS